jgi:magnesium chelatase accessory protein
MSFPIPADWPHHGASEIVQAGGVSWHVQRFGTGPALLLIHGTAASTHSFRKLADALSTEFEIVMIDLPGHGYSSGLEAPTLPRVSEALGALMRKIQVSPLLVAGHSAGAAVAIRMALDGFVAPREIIGLGAALKPYGGAATGLASRLAKLAFLSPITPRLFASSASNTRVERLISKTGSRIGDDGTAFYAALLKRPEHVRGALRMMAHWDLRPLLDDLPKLNAKLTLVVGDRDKATPPRDAQTPARLAADSEIITLKGLGHLLHEEAPGSIAQIILKAARDIGLVDAPSDKAPRLAVVR